MEIEWQKETIVPETVDDNATKPILYCANGLQNRASHKLVAEEPGTTTESACSTATLSPDLKRALYLMETYEYTSQTRRHAEIYTRIEFCDQALI